MIQLSALEALAIKAGNIMERGFVEHTMDATEWKEDHTPVTETDKKINDLVLATLKAQYPEVCVIAEEGSCIIEGAEYVVYCDPIDGTIPFNTGLSVSTFCLSVLRNGVPTFAVIYDPFNDRLYSAEKGKGAYLNRTQVLTVSKKNEIDSKTHIHLIWWKGSRNFTRLCDRLVDIGAKWMNLGTIGILGGLVAEGKFEASIFPGDKIWETAAMALIVEEAGGTCTDLSGDPINYLNNGHMNGHVISNGLIHDELLELIKS
jgi:myo-inositol-1(or 4)-monophosphatase